MARRPEYSGVSRKRGRTIPRLLRVIVTFIGSRYDDASDR